MNKVDPIIEKIATCINRHLSLQDEDYTLSKFILNLYKESGASDVSRFSETLKKNGGEFPSQFVDDIYNILLNPIKKESQPYPVKSEPIYSGLSLPNVKIEPQESHIKKEPKIKKESQIKDEIPGSEGYEPKLEVGEIVTGAVSNIVPYGAFIRLQSGKKSVVGLCHVSQLTFTGTKILSPSQVVKVDQQVFVKITKIETQGRRERFSLSMRGIDQDTGLDKSQELQDLAEEEQVEREKRKLQRQGTAQKRRRLTSPERWEIRQLIASGAVDASEYPELNDINTSNDLDHSGGEEDNANMDQEVEIDIELNDTEPGFLKGQVKEAIELAPIKIIKNPEGSMERSAKNGSSLAKEFKEAKINEEQAKQKESYSQDPLRKVRDEVTTLVISEWREKEKKTKVSFGKRTNLPIKEQRETLPVFSMRDDIVKAVRENQFLVIVGETGSGKTTQIVQYLYEEGFNQQGDQTKLIGCTQPRRVAAESVAKRVSEEVGCKIGETVGYTIRFDDKTGPNTRIKYMTDGMLQREALNDKEMSKYSVIMLDEAHERTIATDVLFALLKQAALKNPNLKIIVTSATLDSEKFSNYFFNCPTMKIPGRTFPVEIMYTKEPEVDYLAAALDSVVQIHVSEGPGDILVFLTGQEEIDMSCEILYQRMKVLREAAGELIILPVYSALPSEMQSRIFEPTPAGARKVILATNIAETSVTIDGIYYVIDPGYVKINAFDSKLGMDTLKVSPISQAQANQRSGRAGRTGPGKCYRLYTEAAYRNEMLPNTVPEIQRQNLAYTILMLKAMGINDLVNFEFMDPPPASTMVTALQDLYTLSALGDDGYLTSLGRKMADFPMDPGLAKTLIASVEFGCSEDILSIVAMLSVQSVFYRPKDKAVAADQRKARFHSPFGDHLTLLNVYRAWSMNGSSKQWCSNNFIHERSMRRAQEVRRQLVTIMRRFGHEIVTCGTKVDRIRRALCSGFFKNCAKRDPQEGFKTLVEGTPVSLHPSSLLFNKNPEYVIYHTLLLTTKEYMHCVTVIDPRWLPELAPAFFRASNPAQLSDKKKRQKIVPLYDRFSKDQNLWRLSAHAETKRKALELLNDNA